MPPKTPTQSTFPIDNTVTPKAQTTRGHVAAGNEPGNNNGAFIVPQLPAHIRQAVQETPANGGTAMSSQYDDGNEGRGLGCFIIEDIDKSKRTFVHFLDFLKYLVKCCAADNTIDSAVLLDKVVRHTTEVYNSDEFKDGRSALSAYSSPRSKEEKGYEPFIMCVNKAFELLAKKDIPELQSLSDYHDLVVNDNHEKDITHKYPLNNKKSALKPDLCLVSKRLLDTLDKDKEDRVTLKWSYTPSSLEMKLIGKKGFSDVVEEYAFKPGTAHVNEYFVLPDIELGKGELCASKRLLVVDKLVQPEKAFSTLKVEQNQANKLYTSSRESSAASVSSTSASTASTAASSRSSVKRKAEGQPEGSNRPNHRANPKDKDLRPNEQISLYGLEMLCRGIYSLHTTNLLVVDDIIYIWRHDRQNVIQSTGLNFITDMPYFMAMLVAFQRFKLEDWGVEPSLVPRGMFIDRKAAENPVEITFNNGVVARIVHPASDDLRYRGPVMKGRATCILDATRVYDASPADSKAKQIDLEDEKKAGVIIKASWPEMCRNNEVHIIEKAVEALEQSEDTNALLKHLPKVIGWTEFTDYDTGKFSKKVPVLSPTRPGEPRILRLILFRRLEPLEAIVEDDKFLTVWLDCFKCHYALWNKGIRHGDISVWNLMRDTLRDCGVLNDFDLSVVKDDDPEKERRGGERTGTLPFMARETLDPDFAKGRLPRKYVHEVECFVWVLAWLCVKHLKFRELTHWEWRVGSESEVALAKTHFIKAGDRWLKSRYEKAGEKCILLMQLLETIDALNTQWKNRQLPGEAFPHDIHLRVIELIEEDSEDIEDNVGFLEELQDKIKAEYPREKKVLKKSKKLVK